MPVPPPKEKADYLSWQAVGIIGLGALAWRLLYLLERIERAPLLGLFLDSEFYARVAQSIRLGHGAGDHPYVMSPLYPYFLALFPSIEADPGGNTALPIQVVQAFFGAATCMLAAWIGVRVGGKRVGLAAGVVMVFYAPLLHATGNVLVASLQAFFLTLGLALALAANKAERLKHRNAWWLGVGLALGVAAALRPVALAVAFFLGVVLAAEGLRVWREGILPGVRAFSVPFSLFLGIVVAVAPFTIRNVVVSGEMVLLSANSGINFWIGNHAGATGVFVTDPAVFGGQNDPLGLAEVEHSLDRTVSYREASRWWRHRALADVGRAPFEWFKLVFRKALLFVSPIEIPQLGSNFEWQRERAWTLKFPIDARLVLILALTAPAVQALRGGRKALRAIRLPFAVLLSYAAAMCLFFITGRYRAPIMPTAIVLAAVTCVGCWDLLIKRRHGASGARFALVAWLVVSLGGSYLLYGKDGPLHATTYSAEERRIGMSLLARGRPEEAIEAFKQGLVRHEDPTTRSNLARALREAGRIEEAIEQYELVLQMDPRNAINMYNFGNLLWKDKGNSEGAEKLYRRAIEVSPRFPEVHHNLGAVLFELERYEEAAGSFETALRLAPPGAPWRKEADALLRLAKSAAAKR